MKLSAICPKPPVVVFVEKNRDQNALYTYEGAVQPLPSSANMRDREVKAAVKGEVVSKLASPSSRVVIRFTRTYFSWPQDVATPLLLAVLVSGAGWVLVIFAAAQTEDTVQFAAELLASTVFAYAGTTAARAFGAERNRKPSNWSVILRALPLLAWIGLLGWLLNAGGNEATDKGLEVYGVIKSLGLSYLAPNAWTIATAVFISSGAVTAFLSHKRKRWVIRQVDKAVQGSNLNVANRPTADL